ncbi:hypothetical protein Rleg9DRAFT_7361 [Rhizobium leguminosarum bv. trifolii WSM597]|uniref:Transmembrane protein n=1 Tax=Rhizobium leguminosarum bv. trifolii WSM597 TaxID=754764 RepID=I9NK44_RHILT|nr:hypothetical protein [Rhizobium leguminosarum]EJB02325.1 hypothetical protein Rleg9DRAFT_1121 [Rhizobium leguminosarum bv. trifolii WSM597]EJB08314.1 hypothetical protein Rleg9DRAFT_7361 [Rhizobium leguminosarum bv. trifolii WSM597]
MASREATRSAIRDYGPVVLFALTTVGGMVFIGTAKLWGWSTAVVTVVPLLLMATYFLASLLLAGFRLHNEQAGDNLYYMGFLFTLSSLGVSLYLFAGETSIDTIVRNFGVAVTSTIAGVTLRILFNQMRRDPLDIERSARHELAEMTRRVRTELDASSREFSNYRRVSNQMLSEGFDEIARQAEKNGEDIRKAIESLSREAIKPIQDAAHQLSAVIENHNKIINDRNSDAAAKLTETTSQLSVIIDKFGDAVEAVGKRLGDIRPPEDVIKIELSPAIESIRQMTETHLKRMEEESKRERSHLDQTKEALQPLRTLEEKLDRIADALEKPQRTVEPDPRQAVATEHLEPFLPIENAVVEEPVIDVGSLGEAVPEQAADDDMQRPAATGERKRWLIWQRR